MELERQDGILLKKKRNRSPFASLRKHAFVIDCNDNFYVEDSDLVNIMKQLEVFYPKQKPLVKVIGKRILILQFSSPQRVKMNILHRVDCTIKRIRLASVYDYIPAFEY